jgi:hypothetical protein
LLCVRYYISVAFGWLCRSSLFQVIYFFAFLFSLIFSKGQGFASRVGASLVDSLGCKMKDGTKINELLVVSDLAEYEAKAVKLATDVVLYKHVQV